MERQRGYIHQPETARGFSMGFGHEAKRMNFPGEAQRLRARETIIFMSQRERDESRERTDIIRRSLSERLGISRRQTGNTDQSQPQDPNENNHREQQRGNIKRPNRLLTTGTRLLNTVFQRISPLYMNKSTVYADEYYIENHIKRLNSWYGRLAKRYYRYVAEVAIAKPAELPRGARVLDIGCGVGVLVQQFNKLGCYAIGVDVNEAAIQHSIEPQHCQLVETTAQLPYPDKYFDLVTSREVLEHIPEEAIDDCIDEWDRVSKGKMVHIIAVAERGKSATDDPTHITVQTENWWSQKFQQHGYRTIRNPSPYYVSLFGPKGYFMLVKA